MTDPSIEAVEKALTAHANYVLNRAAAGMPPNPEGALLAGVGAAAPVYIQHGYQLATRPRSAWRSDGEVIDETIWRYL